jgi:hypothetical protein
MVLWDLFRGSAYHLGGFGNKKKAKRPMTETWLGTIPVIESAILLVGCYLYMLGGRSGKWKRRVFGSLLCSTAVWVGLLLMGRFKWPVLGLYPLISIGFSLGYGADLTLTKIVKRGLIVAFLCLSGGLLAYILGGKAWMILPLQGFIGLGSVWLGVKNPLHAAAEEFFVCLLLTECLIMYPLVVSF